MACWEKLSEVGCEETRDLWLKDRHVNCLCICTVGHVDRVVKHDGSKDTNSSHNFGCASKVTPDGKQRVGGTALPSQPHVPCSLGYCPQRLLVLGVTQKAGTDDSCSAPETSINVIK